MGRNNIVRTNGWKRDNLTYGNIFSETSFASTSDFPIIGAEITRSTNKIILSGTNATLFAPRIRFDRLNHPNRFTCLERWKQRVTVKTPATIDAGSFGIGIGIASSNAFDPFYTIVRWSWDTGSPSGLGSCYLYTKETTTGQITNTTVLVPTASTTYVIEVERVKNSVLIKIFDSIGVTQLYSNTLTTNLNTGFDQLNNVGQFAIYQFGGIGTEVSNWVVTSNEFKNSRVCFIGDSNTYGLFASTNSGRWAEISSGNNRFIIHAGTADRTQDVIQRLPEIIALSPRTVVLSIGVNDIRNSIVIGTIQTNINTIINTLEQSGITVKLAGIIASSAVDVTAVQTHYNTKSNIKVDAFIDSKDAGTALKAAYNSGDGLHLTTTGHTGIGNLVKPIIN
jgi:lysophospholipase L1-like esterase